MGEGGEQSDALATSPFAASLAKHLESALTVVCPNIPFPLLGQAMKKLAEHNAHWLIPHNTMMSPKKAVPLSSQSSFAYIFSKKGLDSPPPPPAKVNQPMTEQTDNGTEKPIQFKCPKIQQKGHTNGGGETCLPYKNTTHPRDN